jgi:hypothetical protein
MTTNQSLHCPQTNGHNYNTAQEKVNDAAACMQCGVFVCSGFTVFAVLETVRNCRCHYNLFCCTTISFSIDRSNEANLSN